VQSVSRKLAGNKFSAFTAGPDVPDVPEGPTVAPAMVDLKSWVMPLREGDSQEFIDSVFKYCPADSRFAPLIYGQIVAMLLRMFAKNAQNKIFVDVVEACLKFTESLGVAVAGGMLGMLVSEEAVPADATVESDGVVLLLLALQNFAGKLVTYGDVTKALTGNAVSFAAWKASGVVEAVIAATIKALIANDSEAAAAKAVISDPTPLASLLTDDGEDALDAFLQAISFGKYRELALREKIATICQRSNDAGELEESLEDAVPNFREDKPTLIMLLSVLLVKLFATPTPDVMANGLRPYASLFIAPGGACTLSVPEVMSELSNAWINASKPAGCLTALCRGAASAGFIDETEAYDHAITMRSVGPMKHIRAEALKAFEKEI
jgi:hypothetical protein